jgi:uncharacterized membrane protein
MELKRKLIIFGIVVSTFIFSVTFATLYAQTHIIEGTACSCTLPIPLLIPMFSSFGILVGLISFYLLLPTIERTKEEVKNWIELLDPLEKEVIKTIIENDGKVTQAKISKEIGKVKAFRVLERLKERGIIEKIKERKTNIIKLSNKFEFLLKK